MKKTAQPLPTRTSRAKPRRAIEFAPGMVFVAPAEDDEVVRPEASRAQPPRAPSANEAYAAEAEKAREKLVEDDANRTWNGVLLLPWSEERRLLLEALCAADIAPPDLESCDDIAFVHGAFPRAVKMLYLMHHEPGQWQSQRSRLQGLIDAWGLANVPSLTVDDKMAAVMLTLKIERAHRELMVQRMPEGSSSRSARPGN